MYALEKYRRDATILHTSRRDTAVANFCPAPPPPPSSNRWDPLLSRDIINREHGRRFFKTTVSTLSIYVCVQQLRVLSTPFNPTARNNGIKTHSLCVYGFVLSICSINPPKKGLYFAFLYIFNSVSKLLNCFNTLYLLSLPFDETITRHHWRLMTSRPTDGRL